MGDEEAARRLAAAGSGGGWRQWRADGGAAAASRVQHSITLTPPRLVSSPAASCAHLFGRRRRRAVHPGVRSEGIMFAAPQKQDGNEEAHQRRAQQNGQGNAR